MDIGASLIPLKDMPTFLSGILLRICQSIWLQLYDCFAMLFVVSGYVSKGIESLTLSLMDKQ